jgi:haloalkane dehalogenase
MLIDFTPDKSLYPFESRWFNSSAGRMHYVDEGAGRPILFCHGNPTWSFLYRHIVRQLRGQFRCIAVDYLGFGLSERPEGYGYTIEEHVSTVGQLIDHLGLEDLVIMGQDWGGPIGTAVAVDRADRVHGLVLGNTWFWPSDAKFRLGSKILSSPLLQRRILERNFFVEQFMPRLMTRRLTLAEMNHYRYAQPAPEARRGVAEMPKQIVAARPLLARLSQEVPARLGEKPALIVWGMKDWGARFKTMVPRMQSAFADHLVVELPGGHHYIQEDAPDEIAEAISKRFG